MQKFNKFNRPNISCKNEKIVLNTLKESFNRKEADLNICKGRKLSAKPPNEELMTQKAGILIEMQTAKTANQVNIKENI